MFLKHNTMFSETQHNIFETQHDIFETKNKIIETKRKGFHQVYNSDYDFVLVEICL